MGEGVKNGDHRARVDSSAKTKRHPLRRKVTRFLVAVLILWGAYTAYYVGESSVTWQRAVTLYGAGSYAESVPQFRRHVGLIPDDAYARYWFANALGVSGELNAAVVEFRRAVDLEPGNAEYHAGLGNALWMKKQYPEAEQSYGSAIMLDPKNPKWPTELAFLLIKQGKNDDAKAKLRRALEIDPTYRDAQQGMRRLADDAAWRLRTKTDGT
jgi:tetratricopeptide (TPR) repeat protein